MSELALGWATYNGDHMSMYGVNVGVPKTLVRHLVAYCADTCSENEKVLCEVLLDVLDTPVSPELLPPEDGKISQKTEVPTSSMISFYISCCAVALARRRFTGLPAGHLKAFTAKKPSASG